MIKLVAFDMDGTILDEESRLSQESLRTLSAYWTGVAVASNSRSIRRSQNHGPWPDVLLRSTLGDTTAVSPSATCATGAVACCTKSA